MADMDQWSSDANKAIHISMVQAGGENEKLKILSTFHPVFTYPIFGEEERIFGYQGLEIELRFAAHDLRPNISIYYDRKFTQVGDTAATDIEKQLRDFIPESAFAPLATYEKTLSSDLGTNSFKPPGEKVESYKSKGRDFEIWYGSLADPDVRLLLDRMQIFISFFIEGGTPIKLDDQQWTLERWNVFFLFEILPKSSTPTASVYSLGGYCTTYRFYSFPAPTPKGHASLLSPYPPSSPISPISLPARLRISQFLILPSHRSSGHGTRLYNTIYSRALSSTLITELTVEDPNEAFDDLRDYADFAVIAPSFNTLVPSLTPDPLGPYPVRKRAAKVPTSALLPTDKLLALRKSWKIAPRQFSRMLEMHLLSTIPAAHRGSIARLTQKQKCPDENDRRYYWWRMLVKQRIYKKQTDVLMQVERPERYEKLDEAVSAQEGEYEEKLAAVMERLKWFAGGEEAGTNGAQGKGERAKRKIIDDDEDDEGDMTDRSKRMRA